MARTESRRDPLDWGRRFARVGLAAAALHALLTGSPAVAQELSCGEAGGNHCEQSGTCPAGTISLGQTYDCDPCCSSCGNGVCEPGESPASCPADCTTGGGAAAQCGNGIPEEGEDCSTCPADLMNRPTFTAVPPSVHLGEPVTFTADPGKILDPPIPLWDLGNGDHRSGGTLVYTYPAAGTYDVRLTASESGCGQTVLTPTQPVEVVTENSCGNGVCSPPGESPARCPADCTGPSCGEAGGTQCSQTGECLPGMVSLGATWDCHPCCGSCGNGYCDSPENPDNCPADCTGPSCSARGGACLDVPNARCPTGGTPAIEETWDCKACCTTSGGSTPLCGNGIAEEGEDCSTCPSDLMKRPTFTAVPTPVRLGDPVTLTADAAKILDPPTPLWDLGNGDHLSGATLVYTYPATGTYDVRLTASESACAQTVVTPTQPVAVVERNLCGNGVCEAGEDGACAEDCGAGPGLTVAIGGPSAGEPDVPLAFLAIVTTNPGEAVLRYEWSFGDGGTADQPNPTHTYAADGLYVLSLAVTTNLAVVSAQHVVSVQTVPEVGGSQAGWCGHQDCRWSGDLRFDPITRRLVPTAHMEFLRGNNRTLWHQYHPVLEVRISNPMKQLVFVELLDGYELFLYGQSPSPWVIDVDFWSFGPDGDQPMPGKWNMVLRFFWRELETNKPPIHIYSAYFYDVLVPGCPGGECNIEPRQAQVIDGTNQTFALKNPDPGREYLWIDHFKTTGTFAFPPDAHLSPKTGPQTTAVSPTWVPVPADDQCSKDIAERQAMTNSTYVLDLYNPPQTVPIGRAEFTVIVPWQYLPDHSVEVEGGLAAGATRLPRLRLSPFEEAAIQCDANWCWPDVERLQFERIPARARYPLSLLLSTTAWKAKVMAHEERHERFYNEAGECGTKFYTIEDLKAYIRRCAETSTKPPRLGEPACRVRIEDGAVGTAELEARRALESTVEQFNHLENLYATLLVEPMSEWLAYQVSDQLPPFYIFKWCMHENEYGSGPFTCPR